MKMGAVTDESNKPREDAMAPAQATEDEALDEALAKSIADEKAGRMSSIEELIAGRQRAQSR